MVLSIAFAPFPHQPDTDCMLLASAGYDHTVRLWDVNTAQLLRTLPGHSRPAMLLRSALTVNYLPVRGMRAS